MTPRPPQSCTASSITCCAASVAKSFAMAASRVFRSFFTSFTHAARYASSAPASIAVAMSASFACVIWKSASCWLNIFLSLERALASWSARREKPSAAAATVVRKTSRFRKAILNPCPGSEELARGVLELERRHGMRRDDLDAPRGVHILGIDDEGADAFLGAREDDVEVGDAAVGDPRLGAVEAPAGPRPARRG